MALVPVDFFIAGNGRLFYETSTYPETELTDLSDPRTNPAEPEGWRADPEEIYPQQVNRNELRQLSLFP